MDNVDTISPFKMNFETSPFPLNREAQPSSHFTNLRLRQAEENVGETGGMSSPYFLVS
jgi:hypothetical protein